MGITANRRRAFGLRSRPSAFGLLALAATLLIAATLFRSARSHQAPLSPASDTLQQPNLFGRHATEDAGYAEQFKAKYLPIALPVSPEKEYGSRGEQLLIAAAAVNGWGPAPVFNDNPLVVGQTTVQSRHVTQLRDAINSLRSHVGMSAHQWQLPAAVGAPVTAFTITEMRMALDQALGAPAGGYSAGLAQGQPIKAIHIQELRDRVLGAWQSVLPAPSNLAAVAPSATQINLSWADNSTNETGFQIERTTPGGNAYATLATVGSGTTSWSDTGLTPGVTYLYRVRATHTSASSAYSNEASATTYALGAYSLSLNGVDGYVSVPNSPTLNLSGPLTVEAWIKTDSTAQQGIVERYGWLSTDDGGYALRIEQGRLRFYTIRNANAYDFVEGATAISTGVWHHVAGVFDGSELRVYLDGREDGAKASTVAPAPGTQSLKIGARGNDAGTRFNGLIDEVRVSAGVEYAGDFTAMSIRDAASAFVDPNDGQRGVWLFDGTAKDAADNDNDGTLMGGALLSPDTFGASNLKYENMALGTLAERRVDIGFDGLQGRVIRNQYPDAEFLGSVDGFGVEYFPYATTLPPNRGEAGPRLTRVNDLFLRDAQFAREIPFSGRFRNFTINFPKPASNIKFEGIGVDFANTRLTPCVVVGLLFIQRVNEPNINLALCGRINEEGNVEPPNRPKVYDLNKNDIKNVTQMVFHTIQDVDGLDFDSFSFTVPTPTPTPEVKSVAFEALSNSGPIDRHPTDPVFGCQNKCGQRIFPDKNNPGDTANRARVRVKAVTTFPQGTRIFFKSFDLDDPSSNEHAVDDTGSMGLDNKGGPPRSGTLSAPSALTDAQGVATVEFQTTKQPGDNFMVAASQDESYLFGLTESGIGIQDAGGNALPTFKAKATEMLTVWRRLHIEVDSMGAARGNRVVATAADPAVHVQEQTQASLINPDNKICVQEPLEFDRFEGGRVEVGAFQYLVINNDASCLLVAAGADFTPPPAGTQVTIYDDDDFNNNNGTAMNGDEGEDIPAPALTKLQAGSAGDSPANNLFAPAYIRPVYDVGDNNNSVPFAANVADNTAAAKRALYDFDQRGSEADVDFWTVYVLNAYQYTLEEDFDPNFEQLNIAIVDNSGQVDAQGSLVRDGQGVLLFVEQLREGVTQRLNGAPVSEFALSPYHDPHEIGHLFGARHSDGGLMGLTSGSFTPGSLNKIRSTPHP